MRKNNFKLRYFFCTALYLLFAHFSIAAVSQGINYQAVVRNSSGAVMPNQHVNLRFSIRVDNLNGNIAYSETDTAVATEIGIFTVVIGGGNIVSGSFDSIHWGLSSLYLQVEMDITGGTNFVNMGTSQLVNVPTAFFAKRAGAIDFTPTNYPTVTGNDTLVVGSSGYIVVTSVLVPSAAVITLTPGVYTGQVLCIAGASSGSNGVRFQDGGLLQLGTGGPNDLQAGSVLTLMWNGSKWLKMAFSSNQ